MPEFGVRRNNLSLGELGIATGQYGYTTDTMQTISASYADDSPTPQINLSWCNANNTSKPIKISDFYGEVSGAFAGIYGQPLPGDSAGADYHWELQENTNVDFLYQFENTGSLFRSRIASRWQNFTKLKSAAIYWEINEETTNFQTYFDHDDSPSQGDDQQDGECGIDLVRPPMTTPTYYGSLTASFCDCFNYQFSGLGNLRAPFSQSMRYSVVRALGGGGS